MENIENKPSETTDYVVLPSLGLYYKGPFQGLKQLKVRELNWEDEDILTTKAFYDDGSVFTEVLKNTIVDENGFSANSLVNVDKDVILWWLRIKAFGPIYKVPHTCTNPKCKKVHTIQWDLTSFNMPTYRSEDLIELTTNGCKKIILPVSGLEVNISAPTTGKELDTYKRLNLKKEKGNISRDFNTTGRLLTIITSAKDKEGNIYSSPAEINKWLLTCNNGGRLSIADSRFIQTEVKDITLTVDTAIEVVCPHCQYTDKVEMPLSVYFFYPDFIDKVQ
jgi:hypothetical protein